MAEKNYLDKMLAEAREQIKTNDEQEDMGIGRLFEDAEFEANERNREPENSLKNLVAEAEAELRAEKMKKHKTKSKYDI